MPTTNTVILEVIDNQIAVIRLNRPEKLNAMSAELMTGIYEALDEISQNNAIRVVILTGEGRGFCSGLDLDDHGMIPGIDNMTIPRMAMKAIEHWSMVVPEMRRLKPPIIGAINGPSYGGGMCLAAACDIRIASKTATFNSTGIVNGLTSTELGVSYILPRLIGFANAADILLTGRVINAEEAERMGLVSRIEDDAYEAALALAKDMCKFSLYGLHMTKEAIWAGLETPSLEAAMVMENRNQILLGMTENLEERKASWREDRDPEYTDGHRTF